jgi:hypothetical protein
MSSGLRAQGLEFSAQGLEFSAQGLEFSAQSLEFSAQGLARHTSNNVFDFYQSPCVQRSLHRTRTQLRTIRPTP